MDYLRKCRVCGFEAKFNSELELFVRDKQSKYGRTTCCLECRKVQYSQYDADNRIERAEKGIKHYHKTGWKRNLSKYGITESDYYELLEKQGNSCAICGVNQSHLGERLSVDHCHIGCNVRGLLCRHCNLMLGNASDKIEILENAILYLKGEMT